MIKAPPQRDINAKKREKESKSSVSRLYRSAFHQEHFLPRTNSFRRFFFGSYHFILSVYFIESWVSFFTFEMNEYIILLRIFVVLLWCVLNQSLYVSWGNRHHLRHTIQANYNEIVINQNQHLLYLHHQCITYFRQKHRKHF